MKSHSANAPLFPAQWLIDTGRKDQPLLLYVWRLALIAALPVAFICTVATYSGVVPVDHVQRIPNWHLSNPAYNALLGYIDMLALSPLVETALMIPLVRIFGRIGVSEPINPIFCGLVWGLVHVNYLGSILGMASSWPFYCFTCVLMAHEKPSLDRAWLLVSFIHGITNVIGFSYGALLNVIWAQLH